MTNSFTIDINRELFRLNQFFKNLSTCLEFLDKSGNYTINSIESTSAISLHKNLLRKSGIKNSQTRRIAENLISIIITKKKNKSYIKPDTPINVYTRFCLNTAKSKFSLVSPVAD